MTSSFPATRWSIIAAAGAVGEKSTAQKALAELCRVYWFPLYTFARRKGLGPEDAEDATQTFFASILESEFFASADASVGRLRTFLLGAFSKRIVDFQRSASRLKRGGGVEFIPFDLADAEQRLEAAPTRDFDADWAAALIESAVRKLEADYAESGRSEIFTALLPYLGTTAGEPPDQAQIATTLGMSHVALRQTLLRFRDRFRTALRAQIADTLREPSETAIDDELRTLSAVLSAGN